MKCKRCGEELQKGVKKCPKCGMKVKGKSVWKWFVISGIILLCCLIMPIVIVIGGDIAIRMSFAKFFGFFNSMNSVDDYKYLSEKYPFYIPAQQALFDVQLAEAEDCDGYRYPYEWAVERLESIDPYISAPSVQAQLDEQIAYYEGLVQQVKDDMYEMIVLEDDFTMPAGNSLEAEKMSLDVSSMEHQYYVEWNGKIYFRQYGEDSIECYTTEYPYGYTGASMDVCDIMCMDETGKVTFVCKDTGFGPFYIVDVPESGPMIYGIRINQAQCWEVYSCDLTGNNENVIYTASEGTYYGETKWVAFVAHYGNNIIFTNVMDSFYCIETDNGNYLETLGLNSSSLGLGNGTPFAYDEDCVYLWDWENDGFEIRRVSYDEQKEILVHIPEEEILPALKFSGDYETKISRIEFVDKYMCFQLSFIEEETGEVAWNSTMVLDTENEICTRIPSEEYLDYQIVYQDENLWVYYYETDITDKIRTISECVQVVGTQDAPIGVNPYAEVGAVTLAYNAQEEKQLIATPDYNGYSHVVLTDEEVQALYYRMVFETELLGEPIQWNILNAECTNAKLFFSIEFHGGKVIQDAEGQILYSVPLVCDYCKDLKTGEITLLHSY